MTNTSENIRAANADRLWRLQTWLGIQAGAKPKVYGQIFAASEIGSLSYWLEIFFSAGIATFGLVESSPAVIIGAMLISPLMGPIMGTGLALAVGDLFWGIKAVLNLLVSIAVSIAFSGFLVWLLPFHSATPEILSRTTPNLLDLGIALLSGLAGSVVVSRGSGDGVTALPGVAIAVALMPPLCVMGFGLGSGANFEIMGGAGLLFLTNLVAIVASAFLVFLLVGLNTAEVQTAMIASRRDNFLGRLFSHGPVARMLSRGGLLRWRILMILVLLAVISLPLRRALQEVARETLARKAVQEELKRLAPLDTLVSQQVSIVKEGIIIHLIATKPIPDEKVSEARRELMRRTGQDVQISVEAVASKSELAAIMERLTRSVPEAAEKKSIAAMQKDVLDKVRPALQGIWPSSDAPIHDFAVAFGDPAGISITVHYEAAQSLGDVPVTMVQRNLQTSLGIPDLTLNAVKVQPADATHSPANAAKPKQP
ncbi:MAG: DUF389 domain-containing protein [Bryobacteraceae bacterium]|jgi:uncharacterized hydrophobic protein (TIGR00271 family)